MKFRLLLIKRMVEDIVMSPFILLGRLWAYLKPLDAEYKVFYFFPFFHTGGAEKVHALVAKATGGADCIIFFTRKSHNEAFLEKFRQTGCVIKDISRFTDNKWIYFVNIIFRGIISGYINNQVNQPVVFNGQSNFGYKLSPWVRKDIRQVELIHSISNFSYIRIPFLPFITQTIMISLQKIEEHLLLYRRFGIPESFDARITYIPNASEFEAFAEDAKDFSSLKVLYSGRGTLEKRAHLVAEIAEQVHRHDPDIHFVMAGDDFEMIDRQKRAMIDFKGNIQDETALATLYKDANILLLTSATEGFPLAVIEGMAYGCAIIATPVGDIPEHVKGQVNGFLFTSVNDEELIVFEGVSYILQLKNERALLQEMSRNNIQYANGNFSFGRFAEDYHKIIFA